jgi:hypothetical protein
MAATVDIVRLTGSGPTASIITSINTRANALDSHTTADATSPIQIPTSGSNYSYWVNTRLTCSVTPAGTINNLRWYSDGANNLGTGVTMVGNEATAYTQATGTAGVTGTQLTVGAYTGGTLTTPVDPFTFTSGSPKSLAGSLVNPNTGQFGSLFVYQLVIGATASPGVVGSESFTWKWDET